MKTKQRTLIVLLVLVFLAGGAFAALTAKNARAAQAESAVAEGTIPLSSFAADDLTELAVTYNGETNTLTVADGSWTLAEDPAYHLDATACNTMVTVLSALNAKRQLTEETGEDYGFTDASLTVTVTAAGETNTFTFGAENAATGDIYLKKAGDDALYTVAASKAACFALSRAELFGAFNPAGLTRSAIESVTLACGDEPFTLTAVPESPTVRPTPKATATARRTPRSGGWPMHRTQSWTKRRSAACFRPSAVTSRRRIPTAMRPA